MFSKLQMESKISDENTKTRKVSFVLLFFFLVDDEQPASRHKQILPDATMEPAVTVLPYSDADLESKLSKIFHGCNAFTQRLNDNGGVNSEVEFFGWMYNMLVRTLEVIKYYYKNGFIDTTEDVYTNDNQDFFPDNSSSQQLNSILKCLNGAMKTKMRDRNGNEINLSLLDVRHALAHANIWFENKEGQNVVVVYKISTNNVTTIQVDPKLLYRHVHDFGQFVLEKFLAYFHPHK